MSIHKPCEIMRGRFVPRMFSRLWLMVSLLLAQPLLGAGLEPFFEKWAASEAALGQVRIPFTQEVKNPALRDPAIHDGVLWRLTAGDFRWELGQPARTILSKKGEALQLWEAETDQWTALNPKDRRFRSWLVFLNGEGLTEAALSKDFELRLALEPPVLTLVPRSSMMRRHMRQIELQFASGSMHLRQLMIQQADGGSTTMRFSPPERVKQP
jgi:outer membrane lipoprotein-sorting protein